MKKNKNQTINKFEKWIFFVIALAFIFAQFFYLIVQNQGKFFGGGYANEYKNLKNAYYSSQYAKKDGAGIIPDETFESFAAGAFLKGMNPILIVHDHPPLGRYLLSLSIVFFDNASTLILFFLSLSFLGIFLISYFITKNIFLSLIPVAIFANEPLTLNKLLYAPLPEPVQLPFIIFAFYFFFLGIKNQKKILPFIVTSILLGFVISIRFFVTGALMVVVMGSYLLFFKKSMKELLIFGLTLPLSLIVLLLSYTKTIQDGYSIIQIFGVQKYILAYHKSAFTNAFSFWDLILFNRWHTWWGEYEILSDPQWRIYWPIAVVISSATAILALVKKIQITQYEIILILWVVGYSLMLSTGYTSTRYFLPLLPFIYILLVTGFVRIVKLIRHDKAN